MNTNKEQLLADINSYQGNLDVLFKDVADKRQLVLASHEDATATISTSQSNLLKGLGFNRTQNIEAYEKNKDILNKAGLTIETIDELKKIKETYGKDIIGYNQLVRLCTKYNLYFGDSSYFIGKIPMKNIKELESFPFSTFGSHYSVISAREKESIIDGTASSRTKAMIVAPLNLFKLDDVLITNTRELIDFSGIKSKCTYPCAEDPIVIVPFKTKGTNEIFFLIVTHWDNTNSII